MLGRDHALLGAVAAVGLGEPIAHLAHRHLPPGQLAAAAVVTASFSLLPDIDEPGSTVSRKLGPVSRGVAAVTKAVAGGHRQATHSLLFVAGVAASVWALQRFTLTAPILVYAGLALTITILIPGHLARKGSAVALLAPVAAGWAVWRAETGSWLSSRPGQVIGPHGLWTWLALAAGAGVGLHLVGDMLTAEGVPLLWPMQRHLAIPLLGHTQSLREVLVGLGLSAGLAVLMWFEILSPLIPKGTP